MRPSPLRSVLVACLCFAAAVVGTLGAVYEAGPAVSFRSPDGVLTELAPAPLPGPGEAAHGQ